MRDRKNIFIIVAAMILLVSLSGCMAGSMMAPDREVDISTEAAIEAQNALLAGAATGSVELTESQFSSLLTALLANDPNNQIPVEGVTAMFEPDTMYLNVHLDQALLGLDKISLAGAVMVDDNNMVVVDLHEAAAGPLAADPNLVAFIGDRITAALDDPALGTVVGVSMGEGTLALSMGQ